MPHNPDHKRRTRQKILENAHRLFSSNGFEATSIEEIMLECELTRGGFYAHFRNKGQLYEEAMSHAVTGRASPAPVIGESADRWLDEVLVSCLRPFDSSELDESCWAFLATDVASKQPEVRAAYTHVFNAVSQRLSRQLNQSSASERALLAALTMTVGTLAVAMTVDDISLKSSLVNACREHAKALFEDRAKDDRLSFFWGADASDNSHGLPRIPA